VPYKLNSLIDVPLDKIDCILVPALGFDQENYRIGYGQGYYDRFLASVGSIHTIGVGFQEQLCEELLPRDPWDVPVKELILV
jgi:5-formyltetrahydrofolate cyclo-ligase